MTNITHNEYARLTDDLERELTRKALSCNSSTSSMAYLGKALTGIKKGLVATGHFIVAASEALNEARAKSAHYPTRSHW